MHIHYRRAKLLACALLLGSCSPISSGIATSPGMRTEDEGQIRAALAASAEAWNRADLAGHLAMYDSSVTYMVRSGPRPGVPAIEQSFRRTFFKDGQPKQQLRFEQISIRPLGREAALGTGRFVLHGGGETEKSGWFTLIWMRTASGWKAIHDHSS